MKEGVKALVKKEDIIYTCQLTRNLSSSEKEDFVGIFNTVFNMNYTLDWFNWKYIENIYGDSYIVLAYDDKKAIGARAFWRNDIEGFKCFQPCDTAVLKEYRGLGIFTKMTLKALENTKGAFIYNYPNENSRPGYIKLGWNINKYFYLKPVLNRKKLKDECKYIEDEYLNWRFGKSPISKYSYYEEDGYSYLLYNRGNNIYYVLGKFNSKYNGQFEKADSPILLNYTDKKGFINNLLKNKATVVSFNNAADCTDNIDIPIFKADYF